MKIVAVDDGFIYPYIQAFSKVTLEGIPWVLETGGPFGEYFVGFANSPYNVERVWDIFQMANADLLIGGAIASDTLQPGLFRGITRIHADGSIDHTFPVIDITPNNAGGAIREIFPAPDGSWYVSGSFTALNGHETNHVAKLNAEFEVDTTFVSPFMYDGPVNYTEDIILVDSQSRIWVSGYRMRLLENPNDTIQLCRLLPGGALDPSFPLIKLNGIYPDSWMTWKPSYARGADELEAYPGNYLIYGSFSHYNDTPQACITVVNEYGVIQENFFHGQGATLHTPYEPDNFIYPTICTVEELDNGDLLVGGGFSQFMGETHYSVVKLKQGFVGVENHTRKPEIKINPNPASDFLNISSDNANTKSGVIFSALGYEVDSFTFKNGKTQIDIRNVNPGIYFVKVQLDNGEIAVGKFVKTR